MTDDELRTLVREAIARHLGSSGGPHPPVSSSTGPRTEISFARFTFADATTDGPCLIEPGVRCTHCGFCQTYGH